MLRCIAQSDLLRVVVLPYLIRESGGFKYILGVVKNSIYIVFIFNEEVEELICYLGNKNLKAKVVNGKTYCGGQEGNLLTPIIHSACSNCRYNLAVETTLVALEDFESKLAPVLEKMANSLGSLNKRV